MNYYHISVNSNLNIHDKLLSTDNYFEKNILGKLKDSKFPYDFKKGLYKILKGDTLYKVEQLYKIEADIISFISKNYSLYEIHKTNEHQVLCECIFETIRRLYTNFNDYPSRLKSIFLTEKESVHTWCNELKNKYEYNSLTIYKVDIIRKDNIFNSCIVVKDTIVDSAILYWQQDKRNSSAYKETLFQGELEIVEICSLESFSQ